MMGFNELSTGELAICGFVQAYKRCTYSFYLETYIYIYSISHYSKGKTFLSEFFMIPNFNTDFFLFWCEAKKGFVLSVAFCTF